MRRIFTVMFFAAGVIALTAAFLSSCAKAEPENVEELEKLAFDAWVQKYVTERGIQAVRQSNGIYVEFLEEGDQTIDSSHDTVVWLRLDYTDTDISKNVFVTRDSIQALRQRTYTPYTYYTPDYIFCSEINYGMSEGRYFAMRNDLVKPDGSTMKMSTGSKVRLYIPASLAYGSNGFSDNQGYGGQYSLGESKIVIEELSVAEVIKDPIEREERLVGEHALSRWRLAETDTIATHFYVDTVNFTPRADLLARFPNKEFAATDTLGLDSTAVIWFVGRFLDGFIFDTNIPSVHEEFYNRRKSENYGVEYKTLSALSFTPSTDEGSYISAFYQAIPKLRRGQWSRIVFTSAYGYGATGISAALKQRQKEQQAYYDYYMQYYMYNSAYGYGSSNYYNNYYNNYYYGGNYDYYGYSTSGYSENEDEQEIVTEIQPYTPLVFEIYIEAAE